MSLLLKRMAIGITLVSILVTSASADALYGGRKQAKLQYYIDESAVQAGYAPHFRQAASAWNGINAAVRLTESSSPKNADRYFVGYSQVKGLLGAQVPYMTNFWGKAQVASTSDTWQFSTVILYQNNMSQYGMTYKQRLSSAIHEIGHSLSLAHPTGQEPSVMRQGISDLLPTSYDRFELNKRWLLNQQGLFKPELKTLTANHLNIAANYESFTQVPEADANADLILLASPTKNFEQREHVVNYFENGQVMDFYTTTRVKVDRVIKAPTSLNLKKGQHLNVIEPISTIATKDGPLYVSYEDYQPMLEGQHYLIFLQKNSSGHYSVMNMSLGTIDIERPQMLMKSVAPVGNGDSASFESSAVLASESPDQHFINDALSKYVTPTDHH